MRSLSTFRKTYNPFLRRFFRFNKPICSNSHFPTESENPSQVTLSTAKPEHEEEDSRLVEVLLNRKEDPISALRFYNWVKQKPGSFEEDGGDDDDFWVLIHILVASPSTYGQARDLLIRYVSTTNPMPKPSALFSNLMDSAKSFGFEVSPRAYNYLLNAYVREKQTDYAVDCVNLMVELGLIPFVKYVNNVLNGLIRRNSIKEAKELYSKVASVGDNVTTQLLMRASLREDKPEEALEVFSKAVERGVEPDGLLYSLAVQTCCKTRNLVMAFDLLREMKTKTKCVPLQETYTSVIVALVKGDKMEDAVRLKDEMVSDGIPMNVIVATSLITGHCKRNVFSSALDMFYTMEKEGPSPNHVTFSVLIEHFSKKGDMENAVEFYEKMKSLGITPSVFHVQSLIQGWLKDERHEEAMKLFDESFETGLADIFVCNNVLSWLCKRGKLDEAADLLRKMESKGVGSNVVSYNNLMLAFCQRRNMDLARTVFSNMIEKGIKPNSYTYSILIDGCFKNHDEQSAWEVFDQIASSGIVVSDVIYQTVISGLCKVGQTLKAKAVLENLRNEKQFCFSCMGYNSIIDGFIKEGEMDSAVSAYKEMCGNGISPNVVTYTSMMDGLCKNDRMDQALEMRKEMTKKGLKLDIPAYGALINGFCRKRDMESATALFSELREEGLYPNEAVYNSLISGYRNLGNMEAAMDLYKRMLKDGLRCDLFTYTTLIDGLLKDGNLILASDLYTEMQAAGIVADEIMSTVLVKGLTKKKGPFAKVVEMFEEMKKNDATPNLFIYNAVIAGHFREGNLDEAFRLHDEMLEKGLVPDSVTFDILVSAKARKSQPFGVASL